VAQLCGLFDGSIREASLGNVDDVSLLSEDEKDTIVIEEVYRAWRRPLALS
jgi:hypothetical protein